MPVLIRFSTMTVAALSADDAPSAATAMMISPRSTTSVAAGTYPYTAVDLTTDWHVHDLHQIEYAIEGVVQVETSTTRYLLPPQRAVWIPAGLAHRTTINKVSTVSVFFEPAIVTEAGDRARVLAIEPVLREMIKYAVRWPIDRECSDPAADLFFRAMAALVAGWLEHEVPFHLPTSDDPVVAAAMRYTDSHLRTAGIADVCAAAAVSERTLRRRFATETAMTWRQYLLTGRLLRAMTMLAETENTVLRIATDVGFASPSAFARAFTAYTGQSPSDYRQHVRAGSRP